MISEIDYVTPCPVEGCKNNSTLIRWTHTCGGYQKITNQGRIYCCKCNQGGLLIDHKFNCGAHDYKYASSQGLCRAVSVMAQLAPNNQLFFAMLMKTVTEQYLTKLRRDDD